MKKFHILIADDWELKGNGLGNVAELQQTPALFLMDLCEKLNIKMTFMVDVAQQLKFMDYQKYPEIKEQKELWDDTVKLMKRRGFDVQLHLHPQWIDAKYENGFFYVGDNWNIGTYDDEIRSNLVQNSVKYLQELLKQIDSEYKINSFKPGSWGIQPSEGILNDLNDNGINLVVGVKKNFYVPNQKIDYRNMLEDIYIYSPNIKDITKLASEKNNMIVVPLLDYYPNILNLSKLVSHTFSRDFINKIFCKNNNKKAIPKEIQRLKPLGRPKFNNLMKPYKTNLKIGNQPFSYLKSSFDDIIKKLEKSDIDNIPILIESHTKDYIDNYQNIEKFLNYIVKKYGEKCDFITLSDFLDKIANDEFKVQDMNKQMIKDGTKEVRSEKNKFVSNSIDNKNGSLKLDSQLIWTKISHQLQYYIKKLIRQGFTFNIILKNLEKSQYFSTLQLEQLQNKKLQKIVRHCYKNVPYYRNLFDNLNLKPEDIKTKKDLEKLPFLDKYIIKENYDKLIAKNKSKFFCNIGQTSGTTGTPLELYRDYYSINFENAIVNRFYSNVIDLKSTRKVTLRGQLVVPVEKQTPPFWEYDRADNDLIMSSYHLSNKTAKIFVQKIKEFNPQVIYAYPSAVYLLAQHFDILKESLDLKAIFTSSEKLEQNQREFIERVFNCNIYDWYGQAERVVAIGQCEKGKYHIIEDYSIVETIPSENGLELVGTNLDNYIMPLLRYKTGDYVKLGLDECSCDKKFRTISEIQGREATYILTKDGPQYVAFNHIPRGVENLIEMQIVQEKIGELLLNITTNSEFSEKAEQKLIKNVIEHTSDDMKVRINRTNGIPRSSNGKFQAVINKLI